MHRKENITSPLLRLSSPLPPDVTLLGNRKLGTLALGQRDPGLCTLTNDKDVGYPEDATSHSSSSCQCINATHRVAKVRSNASFTCTISKPPMCFSRCMITPARPMLRPPVIMTRFPVSNFAMPVILFWVKSNLTVSFTLTTGSG